MILEEYMKKFACLVIMLTIVQLSCGSQGPSNDKKAASPFEGKLISTVDGGGYTFLEIKGPAKTFWAATHLVKVKPGDTVEVLHPFLMTNFNVKSLNRTFKEIYFADGVIVNGKRADVVRNEASTQPSPMKEGMKMPEAMEGMTNPHAGMSAPHGKTAPIDASDVMPLADGVSVHEVLSKAGSLEGKTVKLRVKVTKYLPQIMKRNWIHVVDNSVKDGDLVATTDEVFKVGDTVIIQGKVVVNKDFGYGYKYPVMLEETTAKIQK